MDQHRQRGNYCSERYYHNPFGSSLFPLIPSWSTSAHSRARGAPVPERAPSKGACRYRRCDARTADYEQRLREARLKIFKNLESAGQQAMQSRGRAAGTSEREPRKQVKRRVPPSSRQAQAMAKLQAERRTMAVEICAWCCGQWGCGPVGDNDHREIYQDSSAARAGDQFSASLPQCREDSRSTRDIRAGDSRARVRSTTGEGNSEPAGELRKKRTRISSTLLRSGTSRGRPDDGATRRIWWRSASIS